MKTRYEFIEFRQLPFVGKTSKWFCVNLRSDDVLGKVQWYPRWRQYAFESAITDHQIDMDTDVELAGAIFSGSCLADIQHFIQQLMAERASKPLTETNT